MSSLVSCGIVLPLYVDPPGTDWTNLVTVAKQYPTVPFLVIVNPNNGPVSASEASNYISAMRNILSESPNVFFGGYCDTNSEISLYTDTKVMGFVSQYLTWGTELFTWMFFDDYDFSNTAYTQTLETFCEGLNLKTMGNPGSQLPSSSYIGLFNNWCIYENGGGKEPTASALASAGSGLPASQMSFISYGFNTFPSVSYIQSIASSVSFLNIGASAGGEDGPYAISGSSTQWLGDTAAALSETTNSGSTGTTGTGGTTPPPPPPPPTTTTAVLTVDSVNSEGTAISGYDIEITPKPIKTTSTYTPASFTLTVGQAYSVTADSYGDYKFSSWKDTGSTNATRTETITTNTTLTAIYATTGGTGGGKRGER